MDSSNPISLGDLGERRIVAEILCRYARGIGDDCAVVEAQGASLVLTTDPVPEPAAKLLGYDPDPYWMGWLLVVINASDLAAAGATPLAFLAAVEAPASLVTQDFERFLQGVAEACRAEGLSYVGGNLREGPSIAAVGTAVGVCASGKALTRSGAKRGDLVASVGQGGIFWRDALILEEGTALENKDASPVFRPSSRSEAMRALATAGLVSASIDNSDGLLSTLVQLSTHNRLAIELDLDALTVPDVSVAIDVARLWLGWGDWNVIVCIHPNLWDDASETCRASRTPLIQIGKVLDEAGPVFLRRGGSRTRAPRLESERFAVDSWFATGVQGYVTLLKTVPLPPP